MARKLLVLIMVASFALPAQGKPIASQEFTIRCEHDKVAKKADESSETAHPCTELSPKHQKHQEQNPDEKPATLLEKGDWRMFLLFIGWLAVHTAAMGFLLGFSVGTQSP